MIHALRKLHPLGNRFEGHANPGDDLLISNPTRACGDISTTGLETILEASSPPVTGKPFFVAQAAASAENLERRSEPRYEATIAGRVRLPASEHDCELADLSTGGMNVVSPDAAVAVGMQITVFTQGLPHLVGIVRWIGGGSFGVRFTKVISPDVIAKMSELKRRVRSPRAGRVKTELPALVFFDGMQYEVVVRNISVGGLMMTTRRPVRRGQRKPIRDGQALMIQFPELLPLGGHVCWSCGSKCGMMFSKFLPFSIAEDIVRMGNLHDAWLDDVRLAHSDVAQLRTSA